MFRFILTIIRRRRVNRLRLPQHSRTMTQRQNPYFHRPAEKKSFQFPAVLSRWFRTDGWALGGIVVLIAMSGWYYGFHTDQFTLTDVAIEGVQFIQEDAVQKVVDDFSASRIFGILNRDTFWTLKAEALEQRIVESFADSYALEAVDVSKEFPNRMVVRITERIPQVTWVAVQSGTEQFYTVDREGRVAQAIPEPVLSDLSFPLVRDSNRASLEVGAHIVSAEYIGFLLQMHDQFPAETGLHIDSYRFPLIECSEREYVAETIFQQEILDSASEEFKEKKRAIQELFREGLLTIDQSLEELEHIKEEELIKLGQLTETAAGFERYQWESMYVSVPCDFAKVAQDLDIVTTIEDGGFTVTMDSTVDPVLQLRNLKTVLQDKISDRTRVRYIDVRLTDRVYYK